MSFLARRLALTLLTLFLVSLLTFACFSLIPGDAASLILGTEAGEEQVAALREEFGLDRSAAERYLSWLRGFAGGNLGNSVRFRGEAISDLVLSRLPVTFSLALLSLVFIIILSLFFSLPAAGKTGSLLNRIINTMAAAGISVPGFFLGVLFIWVFGILFKFFSPGAFVPFRESPRGFFGCLVFPALAIAIPNAAIVIKFLRSSIAAQLESPYARTARSKGASFSLVLRRHVFKNALIPAVTILGMIIGEVFSGSIVIEQVFTIPGIGRLLITSISSRDYPLVQTLLVYIAFAVILANTLVDIAIQFIDPRIRL
ncbi:MAG: ABC transporter permease [Treponema sp.]|jgi:ABC-type dipeptide/oligopeptide/nickel transport system permease component|nr:ABC transporter permease [Treponema sp.]